MTLALSIVDNADGTGAVATVSGSDAGSTNTVYTVAAGGTLWTSRGSRTGDGTVALSLSTGYHFAYCYGSLVSGSPALTPPTQRFAVTSGTQSVQERILLAVEADIRAIAPASLPGLPAAYVRAQMAPNEVPIGLPGVLITPQATDPNVGTLNNRDDFQKPAVVMIVDRNPKEYVARMGTYLLWRERIVRYFISQRLAGVPEVYSCRFEPAPIFDPKLPAYEFLVSAFTLRFLTREVRGV